MSLLSQYLLAIDKVSGTEITTFLDVLSRQGGGYYIDPFSVDCSAKGNMDLNAQDRVKQTYGTVIE